MRGLAVGEHPDVGGDAGVVEQLLGQRDDGLQPVVFQYPAPDFAFATARVAGEEGRAVHDDGDAAATIFGVLHARQQVLQEEHLPVADARGTGAKATGIAARRLGLHGCLVHLPLFAIGRIGEQVIKSFVGVLIF